MTQDSHPDNFSENLSFDRQHLPVGSFTRSEPTTTTTTKAGFWIRSIAYSIDRIILSLTGLLFFAVGLSALRTSSYIQAGIPSFENLAVIVIPTYAAMVLIEIAYYTYFHGHTGQTVGKMICGLKVVNLHGEAIGYRRALFRWVGYVISSLIFYLGFFWVAIDRNHQGWHDKIAATFVTKV